MDKSKLQEFKDANTVFMVGSKEACKKGAGYVAATTDWTLVEGLMAEYGVDSYKKVFIPAVKGASE
jgi:hypothetical protein